MPHTRSLLRVARRLTSDTTSADDLVQETLLLAWRGFHQFRAESNARAWLFRILVNEFRARARKLRSSPPIHPLAAEVDAPARSPRIENDIDMAHALDSLSVEHRTVLMLGAMTVTVNLIVDILYAVIDPRIRLAS